METLPLAALVDRLAANERAWVRVVAERTAGNWQPVVIEVTTGEPPPTWSVRRWVYPHAILIAEELAGATVAGWLNGRLAVEPLELDLELFDQVNVERRDSRFPLSGFVPLAWPSIEWRPTFKTQRQQQGALNALVADSTPAFHNVGYAIAAFFGVPDQPNRALAGTEFVVREQDRRARLANIHIGPTELVATLDGTGLVGLSLTLGGGSEGPSQRVEGREVKLPLSVGVQPAAWLALHRGEELVDSRSLDPGWGRPAEGVTYEIESETRLQVMISGGEHETVEFKQEIPGDARNVTKTVAAFANGIGGAVIFGVDDEGAIVGMSAAGTAVDRLTNVVSSWIQPRPEFTFERAQVDGHDLLALHVSRGRYPPYGVGTSDGERVYYVRRGATTSPASPDEIRSFVESRIPTQPDADFPFPFR